MVMVMLRLRTENEEEDDEKWLATILVGDHSKDEQQLEDPAG